MKAILFAALVSLCISLPSSMMAAEPFGPNHPRPSWKASELQPLGARQASAGFVLWGSRTALVVTLPTLPTDKKALAISKLKVSALDQNGKALVVTKHYEQSEMIRFPKNYGAYFDVGTFVQNIAPKDVSSVTVSGFGGKIVVHFVDGHAREE